MNTTVRILCGDTRTLAREDTTSPRASFEFQLAGYIDEGYVIAAATSDEVNSVTVILVRTPPKIMTIDDAKKDGL
jgi:hypothetical protein